MGEGTAPAAGPADGAAAGAGAAGAGAAAAAATPPPRLTRMRAPLCSISISVRPVSFSNCANSRIAVASTAGLASDFEEGLSPLELISTCFWKTEFRQSHPPRADSLAPPGPSRCRWRLWKHRNGCDRARAGEYWKDAPRSPESSAPGWNPGWRWRYG